LRDLGLLKLEAQTVTGSSLGEVLEWWEHSDRRKQMKAILLEQDGVEASSVIFSPARAAELGLTSTVTFPIGNLAPQGSVIKSTSIDPEVVDADGIYRKIGPARVFIRERDAVQAIKGKGANPVVPGDIVVLICGGPFGTGMEEVYQVTSALKHLKWGKEVAVLTDARFSGVSTGACIGHIGPEALAGGPIGKVMNGDLIEIIVDRKNLTGTVNLVGENGLNVGIEAGTKILQARALRPDLSAHPELPDDTRLWAAMQGVSGGTWGGCVFDTDSILAALGK
jgi:xylonate dehydratase